MSLLYPQNFRPIASVNAANVGVQPSVVADTTSFITRSTLNNKLYAAHHCIGRGTYKIFFHGKALLLLEISAKYFSYVLIFFV